MDKLKKGNSESMALLPLHGSTVEHESDKQARFDTVEDIHESYYLVFFVSDPSVSAASFSLNKQI